MLSLYVPTILKKNELSEASFHFKRKTKLIKLFIM